VRHFCAIMATVEAGAAAEEKKGEEAEASLEMSLDDVIAAGRGSGGAGNSGRGRGGGSKDNGKDNKDKGADGKEEFQAQGADAGGKAESDDKTTPSRGSLNKNSGGGGCSALDMSLDELIEMSNGGKTGGKGKKGGKSGGKGGNDSWGGGGGKWDASGGRKWRDSNGSDDAGWSRSSGSKWDSKSYDASWEDTGDSSWKMARTYGGKHESWTSTEKPWTSESGSRGIQSGSSGQRRGRQEDDLPTERRSKRIKVKNIPHDLDWRDIKGAFESEAGKIARCELERGVAWITFNRPEDARKAVETFDRGELNGKTIEVSIER